MINVMLLSALRALREADAVNGPVSTITLTNPEAVAVLDALDLLCRVSECESDATGNGIEIDSETWALLCAAADAIEASQ